MKLRNLLAAGLMAFGAFAAATFTACRDKCKTTQCSAPGGTCHDGVCTCSFEYEGPGCETPIYTHYTGIYKGSGTDNSGATYTNYSFYYNGDPISNDDKDLDVSILDGNGTTLLELPITLTTANTYTIKSTTTGGATYTGSGSFGSKSASIVIKKSGNPSVVITFSSLTKQ